MMIQYKKLLNKYSDKRKAYSIQDIHHVQTPPEVDPTLFDGEYMVMPISGIIQAIPRVPISQYLKNDLSKPITMCCLHILSTISEYPEGHNIEAWATELYALIFGELAHGDLVHYHI